MVRMFLDISSKNLKIILVDTLKRKLLGIRVGQLVRPNLYKSRMHFFFPLSIYLFVPCFFQLHFFLSISLIFFYLLILLLNLYLLYKINLNIFIIFFYNWTSIFNHYNLPSLLCFDSLDQHTHTCWSVESSWRERYSMTHQTLK